jgi:hypothetical protein
LSRSEGFIFDLWFQLRECLSFPGRAVAREQRRVFTAQIIDAAVHWDKAVSAPSIDHVDVAVDDETVVRDAFDLDERAC